MAAPTLVLDPTGLNINLNAQGSATGFYLQEANSVATGLDWGGQAVQDFINTGAFHAEDIDCTRCRIWWCRGCGCGRLSRGWFSGAPFALLKMSYSTVTAWAEYTPRYIHLAPA